jgi:hypothetical protein
LLFYAAARSPARYSSRLQSDPGLVEHRDDHGGNRALPKLGFLMHCFLPIRCQPHVQGTPLRFAVHADASAGPQCHAGPPAVASTLLFPILIRTDAPGRGRCPMTSTSPSPRRQGSPVSQQGISNACSGKGDFLASSRDMTGWSAHRRWRPIYENGVHLADLERQDRRAIE